MAARPKPPTARIGTIRRSSAALCVLLAFAAGLLCGWFAAGLNQSSPSVAAQNPAVPSQSHIMEIERLTREQPGNPAMWIHLGDAQYDAGQPALAIEAYERGLALAPDNLDARTDLGTACRLTGQYDRAIAQYNEVLARNPRHHNARLNKGVVLYYDLDRRQEALDVWNTLLRIAPDAKAPDGAPLKEFLTRLAGS